MTLRSKLTLMFFGALQVTFLTAVGTFWAVQSWQLLTDDLTLIHEQNVRLEHVLDGGTAPNGDRNNDTLNLLLTAQADTVDVAQPGDGNQLADFSDPNYNHGPWYDWQTQDLESWAGDGKNQGPYPRFDTPGTYTLSAPPLRPASVYYLGFWSPSDTTFSVSSSTNGGPIVVSNTLAFYGGFITNILPGHGSLLYRMDVPTTATRILFNANNSPNVVLSLEQGTLAVAGGPAHWTSYIGNNSQNGNQANVGLDQLLTTPNNWPWLPGNTYYLALTNTSASPENLGFAMSIPSDLAPVAFLAPTAVTSTQALPAIQVAWGVTNQGAAPAPGGWYDRIWFSTNGALDAHSVGLGDFAVSQTVPPGGGYWQTNMVTLPMSASGNYTLFVQVDVNDSIFEASLADKVSAPVSGVFTLSSPPPEPPVFQTVTRASGRIIFTWSAVVGKAYQVQYKTNLTQPNWINLVGVPATNSLATASDSIGPDPRRFYRVVLLTGALPPVIQSVTRTGGGIITFTWSAVAGRTYQVQYSTNLTQGTWNNLGSAIPATNGIVTTSDTIGPDAQRFYRVALLP